MKKKMETKKNTPTPCLQPPPSHAIKKIILKKQKKSIFLPWEAIKLFHPMPLKKQPLGFVPYPTKTTPS